jgi:hypothetical protein
MRPAHTKATDGPVRCRQSEIAARKRNRACADADYGVRCRETGIIDDNEAGFSTLFIQSLDEADTYLQRAYRLARFGQRGCGVPSQRSERSTGICASLRP